MSRKSPKEYFDAQASLYHFNQNATLLSEQYNFCNHIWHIKYFLKKKTLMKRKCFESAQVKMYQFHGFTQPAKPVFPPLQINKKRFQQGICIDDRFTVNKWYKP